MGAAAQRRLGDLLPLHYGCPVPGVPSGGGTGSRGDQGCEGFLLCLRMWLLGSVFL